MGEEWNSVPNHLLSNVIKELLNDMISLRLDAHTEPEIDEKHQKTLIACLRTTPCDDPNFFPFLHWKLSRADIEWLLAHPVVDTNKLEKSFELMFKDKRPNNREQEATNFRKELYEILENSLRIDLRGAELNGVNLSGLHLSEARLEYANLMSADLRGTFLHRAHLEHAYLFDAYLEKANLSHADLTGASLQNARLQKTNLTGAHLEGANLTGTHLEGAILKGSFFDSATNLDGVHLSSQEYGSVILDSVHWGNVDLSVVDWTQMKNIGDDQWVLEVRKRYKEYEVEQKKKHGKKGEYKIHYRTMYARTYKVASRANRRLAVELQEQGLNGEASRFAYNAQILQRAAYWWDNNYGQWLFSMFRDVLTGYGYRMWRILIAYFIIVSLCAIALLHLRTVLSSPFAFAASIPYKHNCLPRTCILRIIQYLYSSNMGYCF